MSWSGVHCRPTAIVMEWKTRVGSPKTRLARGVGCGLCAKASLTVSYCQGGQPVLSLSLIFSSFPWVGSANHMATSLLPDQPSDILGGRGKEEERCLLHQPAESTCPVAAWLGTGWGLCGWWKREVLAAGPGSYIDSGHWGTSTRGSSFMELELVYVAAATKDEMLPPTAPHHPSPLLWVTKTTHTARLWTRSGYWFRF